MEKQAIKIAKQFSWSDYRKDTRINFDDACVIVNTKQNSGEVDMEDIIFTQKCFFIAVSDGLSSFGIDHFHFEGMLVANTPFNLMKIADFLDLDELVDTDEKDHVYKIKKMVKALPFIRIIIFFGKQTSKGWAIIPDNICPPIGNGDLTINILNEENSHFEFITTNPSKLNSSSPTINDMTEILKNQELTLDYIKRSNLEKDALMAKKLQENEEEEFQELKRFLTEIEIREKEERIKSDEEFARLVQMEEN